MDYKGVIIEESLENSDVLKDVHVVSTKVEPVTEKHKTPWIKRWTLDTVEIPENVVDIVAEKVSQALDSQHPWYADFKNDTTHIIVFRGKVLKVERAHAEQYDAVIKYGVSLGIPAYQLDFTPAIKEWKR